MRVAAKAAESSALTCVQPLLLLLSLIHQTLMCLLIVNISLQQLQIHVALHHVKMLTPEIVVDYSGESDDIYPRVSR